MSFDKLDIAQLAKTLNEKKATWQASANHITALPAEDRQLRLGAAPGPNNPTLEQREASAKAKKATAQRGAATEVGAPAAFDWRNVGGRNYLSPVRDQGGCGSCVAFGTLAAVEGTFRLFFGDPSYGIDLSEAHLFYCIGHATGASCGGGWWPDQAYDGLRQIGVVDEACYPYTAGDQNCGACADWASRVRKISGWHKITTAADMKTWISTRGPVSVCFSVYDDFFAYSSGVYHHVSGNLAGGHCVSAVGYDDATGCWICQNSWGAGWGDGGFVRIAYGEVGIDDDAWATDGFLGGIWQSNKSVIGLWTNNADRNAWACIDGIGWRRIAFDNDNITLDMLQQLIAAKAANRLISYFEEGGVIRQVTVF